MPVFSSVLRISGRDFEVDAFLRRHGALRPSVIWRAGEARSGGRINSDSGVALDWGEGAGWIEALQRLQTGGSELERLVADARRSGAGGTLDVALAVGGEPTTASISLTPDQMGALARVGLSLTVSAYPVADPD